MAENKRGNKNLLCSLLYSMHPRTFGPESGPLSDRQEYSFPGPWSQYKREEKIIREYN